MTANPDQQFQDLLTRPNIDQISQRYNEMRTTIRDRLVADIGTPPWKEDLKTGGPSACRNLPDVSIPDAQSRGMPLWYSEAAIPDEKWSRAAQIVTDLAKQYGFNAPSVVVNTSGNHEISAKDSYGAELVFGTKLETVLTVLTGCHLTAEAQRRGTPSVGS